MIAYSPVQGRPRLGQFGSLTSGAAKAIVDQAEPATRAIIRDERTRVAEALIGGIPFAALAAVGASATAYLVPEGAVTAKFAGFAASAGLLGLGAWWTFSRITEATAPAPPSGGPSVLQSAAVQAAKAIVDEAEPRIRQIVDEERARIADSLIVGLPFWTAAVAAFVATMFLVPERAKTAKTAGYGGSAVVFAIGAWAALEKERG